MFRRTWMLREAKGILKATVGNRVQPDYHFIHIVHFLFCFFQPEFCGLWQAMLKSKSAHIGDCIVYFFNLNPVWDSYGNQPLLFY